ncbi:MAG: hypothetical protein H6824_22020 [Planctomycetaceae bacterium]|nr:hypothetical protein [Planctomycetaceae bacterium]
MALQLAAQLQQSPVPHVPALPQVLWNRLVQLQRQIEAANQRGWRVAATCCLAELRQTLETLLLELARLQTAARPPSSPYRATARQILSDLEALRDEFPDVEVDRLDQELVVWTESIELDEVYLGPFEIRLSYATTASSELGDYRVVALDPQPAVSDHEVVHPHVRHGSLCEGDAQSAIRSALEQGRVFDFFTLVAHVLRTYNAGSPYVALSEWFGTPCADCAAGVSDDERWLCENCSSCLCGDCTVRCAECDDSHCHECTTSCTDCDDRCCRSCLKPCPDCQQLFCSGCLQEDERCHDCHEAHEATEEIEDESPETSDTPVHTDRVGEAAIPA